ncbi:MAG: helix-turn-helix transcriptional regulator [Candidatus Limnocylindria bacterium]
MSDDPLDDVSVGDLDGDWDGDPGEADPTDDGEPRRFEKRDRLARMLRVVTVLRAHPDGIRPADIARRVGVATRTVYRDLRALEEEVDVATWSEGGRWGVVSDAFLPPLKLTLDEAMAVVLSARLMVRYVDKYDPDLAAAFEKLEAVLPRPLADFVDRTLDILAQHPTDAAFSERVHRLTRAWAEQRVVTLTYAPASYTPDATAREAIVRPYLIEPSLQTHALYLIGWDESRDALRTFKIERIRAVSLTPRTFEPPEGGVLEQALRRAWDIIADQPATEVALRFAPAVAARVAETTWHPDQRTARGADGSLEWRATVSGTIEVRLWILSWGDDVEVLEPPSLRADVAATHRRAADRYGADSGASGHHSDPP